MATENNFALDDQQAFSCVLQHIQQSRHHVFAHINTALIDLYWQIGQIISHSVSTAAWGNQKLSAVLRELHPNINNTLKDNYVLEFLGLPVQYNEDHLQKALIDNMRRFILELGKDFIFVGEEYRLQVGNQDFFRQSYMNFLKMDLWSKQ